LEINQDYTTMHGQPIIKKKDEDVTCERRNGREEQVWVTSIAETIRRSFTNTAQT